MNVKGFNPRRTIIVSFLAISFLGNLSIAQTVGADGRRFNPGHYLAANRGDSATDITRALRSGVTGFQRRYYWAEIEPEQGKYDFSKIRADLDLAASQGMQLVVFIADKTFNRDIPLPNYLTGPQHMAKNRAGGYTALRWKPFVNSRFNALLTAVGQRFNSNNHFEGIAIQESSLSIDKQVLAANGYTPEKYRDAIKASLLTAAAAAPKSRVFWYMNFLTQNQSYLTEIALAVTGKGIVMGGPDVLPDSYDLRTMVYPMYDQFRGKMPLFNSVQFDSYQHIHKEAGFSTKYWTMPELFKFARNNLHVNYLFWSNKYARVPWDSYTVADAYPVMANNPSFGIDGVNASAMPDGADNVDTDQDRLTDAEELALGTDPTRADTDWDSIIDGNEVKIYGTDPLAWDTDGEGLDDGSEVKIYGTNPLARNTDKDWLNDRVEVLFKGTDPLNADTDGDGLSDGLEASSSKGIGTNPLLADSDGGGINDGEEYRRGTNPLKAFDD